MITVIVHVFIELKNTAHNEVKNGSAMSCDSSLTRNVSLVTKMRQISRR